MGSTAAVLQQYISRCAYTDIITVCRYHQLQITLWQRLTRCTSCSRKGQRQLSEWKRPLRRGANKNTTQGTERLRPLSAAIYWYCYNPIYFNHFATTLALNRPPPKAFLIFHRLVRRLMYLPTTLSFLLISLLSSLLLSSSSLSSTALTLIWHTIRGSVVKSSQGFCSWLCPFWPLDLTRADILSHYWYHCNGLEAKSKFKTTNTKVPAHQTNIRTAPWNIANLI